MLKKGILASLLVLLFAGAFAERRQVMLDKVVAVVGGSSILYSDVADYAHQLTAQRRQQGYTSDRDPMNEALEAMLTQKLLYNQAQIDSVTHMADIPSRVEEQVQQRCSRWSSRRARFRRWRPVTTCPSTASAR